MGPAPIEPQCSDYWIAKLDFLGNRLGDRNQRRQDHPGKGSQGTLAQHGAAIENIGNPAGSRIKARIILTPRKISR
jgi:hypothetical protein